MTVKHLRDRLAYLPDYLPVFFDTGMDDEPCHLVTRAAVNLTPDSEDNQGEPLPPAVFLD